MKMKMSIIMGVVHMSLGIFMSLFNHLFFGDSLSVYFQFIPEILFLWAMFGYLCALIIAKWVSGSTIDLYHVLIAWFLTPGDVDCGGDCPENKLFAGQAALQNVLLLLMFVCVPWMLLPKPLILRRRHANSQRNAYLTLDGRSNSDSAHGATLLEEGQGSGGHGHGHGDGFDFGEVFVHQMIHTIEFVLGAISNTGEASSPPALLSLRHLSDCAPLPSLFLPTALDLDPILLPQRPTCVCGHSLWRTPSCRPSSTTGCSFWASSQGR